MINLGKYLYNKFPDLYLSEDSRQGYALKRFFEVLGGGFDEQERYIADFSNIHNVDLCPAPLLPLLAEQYGFEFPYDMDEATQRKFIKVIPFLYQYKGTDRAFKYLAREIFGEGTVTNTYTLSPPAGVSWEEWISNPSTQQDWQKLFVKLEVNGETLFLDERVTNFSKFSELIRPVNMRVVPNLVLFYQDIRDNSLSQEMYDLITVKDNYGIFPYRFRDGQDRITEQELTVNVQMPVDIDTYPKESITETISERLIAPITDELRTSIFYDEISSQNISLLDEEEIAPKAIEATFNTSLVVTSSSYLSKVGNKLVTSFKTNNYIPNETTFSY